MVQSLKQSTSLMLVRRNHRIGAITGLVAVTLSVGCSVRSAENRCRLDSVPEDISTVPVVRIVVTKGCKTYPTSAVPISPSVLLCTRHGLSFSRSAALKINGVSTAYAILDAGASSLKLSNGGYTISQGSQDWALVWVEVDIPWSDDTVLAHEAQLKVGQSISLVGFPFYTSGANGVKDQDRRIKRVISATVIEPFLFPRHPDLILCSGTRPTGRNCSGGMSGGAAVTRSASGGPATIVGIYMAIIRPNFFQRLLGWPRMIHVVRKIPESEAF